MGRDFLTILTAVLAANLFTLLFVWGAAKAAKIGADDGAPMAVALAIAGPALVAAGGAFLFGK